MHWAWQHGNDVVGLNRHVWARQMGGQRAAIGATLVGTGASTGRISLVVIGFVGGDGLLDL